MLISTELLGRYRSLIQNHPQFRHALLHHCEMMFALYRQQPLFYKMMFRETRFNSVLAVCCLVFGNQASSLSDVKQLCARYRIASPNSIIAILAFLKTAGRLALARDPVDRRKTIISPTALGLEGLKGVIECVFNPLAQLYPTPRLELACMDDPLYRHDFYYRAASSLFRGLTFEKVLPAVGLFIDKDAGRHLLLRLYQLGHDPQQRRMPTVRQYLNRLAPELKISRTHLRRIVAQGCAAGYFIELSGGELQLQPSFFTLAEEYGALYFGWTLYFANVRPR